MNNLYHPIPATSYGILNQDKHTSQMDEIAEQVRRLGYAILDSGLSTEALAQLSDCFNQTRLNYYREHGESNLKNINEFYTIRAPLAHGGQDFLDLATNANVLELVKRLITGKFILNQQNCVINPPGEKYNQGAWHRDLPYQHFIASSPLAINALFCLDDFTKENGSTFVLPASHKTANYPSESYVRRNALQIEAEAGQFIILDCMVYHSGGFNFTNKERRAINHVFTIPYFKQQINLSTLMENSQLTEAQKDLFAFNSQEPFSIQKYLSGREKAH